MRAARAPRAAAAAIAAAALAALAIAGLAVRAAAAGGAVAEPPAALPKVEARQRAALAARAQAETRFAWQAYERYAWGHDELRPVSHTVRDWYAAPLLITPVDALDTLVLLGLHDEAAKARKLIDERLSFDHDISVKNFEITIRLLGGLLSGYQMTGDGRLLQLADDLGRRLLPAFNSPTGMPYTFVNLRSGKTSGRRSNPAEIGTLLLEFGTLSRLTGKPVFYDQAKRAVTALYERRSKIGLVGDEIDVESGAWTSRASHLGGGIDSYYEYLFKCWRLFGDADCGRMWQASLTALDRHLADQAPSGFWYGVADMQTGARLGSEFGALQAFFPAVLALAGRLEPARRLEESCFKMWTLKGIEPDALDYRTMRVTGAAYPLRPEIIESAYYLRRLTGDARYLAMGQVFFDSLAARCRVADGYTVLENVETGKRGDLMPSYFLAESLKYLYLLFAPDDALDLQHIVFNTEAHPLRPVPVGRRPTASSETRR